MKRPIANDLLRFASSLEGARLTTLSRGAGFTLRAMPGGLEITPESSGVPRMVSREIIERVCEEYGYSRSTRPVHYQAITFDASYLLAVITHYLREHRPA